MKEVDNPAFLPDVTYIEKIEEPMVKAFVICPNENIGDMMALISEKRGKVDHTETLDAQAGDADDADSAERNPD